MNEQERGCVPPWRLANIITLPSFITADGIKLADLREEGNQH